MSRADRVTKGVTRVEEKRNVTTGNQMNLRLTGFDDDALLMMVDKIQELLPNKNITRSKILRAVGYLYTDQKMVEKLASSIITNT